MPFKIFRTHKKGKEGRLQARSKSVMDLVKEEPPDQPPDPNMFISSAPLQFRSKSNLHLFQPSKPGSHVVMRQEKNGEGANKRLNRTSVHVMERVETTPIPIAGKVNHNGSVHGSKNHVAFDIGRKENHSDTSHGSKNHFVFDSVSKTHVATDDSQSSKSIISDLKMKHSGENHHDFGSRSQPLNHVQNHLQNHVHHHSHGEHGRPPRKSASCNSIMDANSRDRRLLLDIAQLDNYIAYLRRNGDDGYNMASRMCCAQVLRMACMKLKQRYVNEVLHSTSPQESFFSTPSHHNNLSLSPPSRPSPTFQRRMTSFRRRPPYLQNLKSRHPLQNHSGEEDDDERSDGRVLSGSEDKDDGDIPVFLVGSENEEGQDKESDYVSISDSDSDNCGTSARRQLHRPKSIPVFPTDIEIY